jgi:hypothetical protein
VSDRKIGVSDREMRIRHIGVSDRKIGVSDREIRM